MRIKRMQIIDMRNKWKIKKKLQVKYGKLPLHIGILFLLFAPITHYAAESGTVAESGRGQPPVAVAQSVPPGPTALVPDTMLVGDTVVADIAGLFKDPDGDPLSYSVESSAPSVVRVVSLSSTQLTLLAAGRGPATVTVTASDPMAQSASVAFRVRVSGSVPGLTEGLPRRPFVGRTVGDRTVGTLRLGLNPDVFPVIVMESEDRSDVLVAASWLGEGRVVAFSGQDFLSSHDRATLLRHPGGDRLLANAVRWAGSDRAMPLRIITDSQRIADVLAAQGLKGSKVVGGGPVRGEGDWRASTLADADVAVVQVNEWGTPRMLSNSVAPLRAFVERGGGLLVAGSAIHWDWWSEDKYGPFVGNILLRDTGISWNLDTIEEIGSASTDIDLREVAPISIWSQYLDGGELDALQTSILSGLFESAIELSRRAELDEALTRLVSETPPLPTPSTASKARLAAAVGETLGPYEWPKPHPWAAAYPGLPKAGARRVDAIVTVDASWSEFPGDASRRERHFPLGFYALPSTVVTIEVPAEHAKRKLRVAVGELHDPLDIFWNRDANPIWHRAPKVRREFPIGDSSTAITNAYGGSIALIVPTEFEGAIPVTVRGGIPMAVYTEGQSDSATWFADLEAGAPQAIIQKLGGVRLVISTERARSITDPGEVAKFWGRFQQHHAELAGEPTPRAYESIWIFDPQLYLGANAGPERINHPLYAEHWALLPGTANGRAYIAQLRERSPPRHVLPPLTEYSPWAHGVDWWGFGHELGHQWQTDDWGRGPTGREIGEVAVNLFTMYTLNYYIFGGDDFNVYAEQRTHPCAATLDHAALANRRWSTAGDCERLAMYRQLIAEFGWQPMKKVFHSYYDPAYPRSTYGGELDGFAIRFSVIVGRDLVRFLRHWEYPLSDSAADTIRSFGLETWLPPGW